MRRIFYNHLLVMAGVATVTCLLFTFHLVNHGYANHFAQYYSQSDLLTQNRRRLDFQSLLLEQRQNLNESLYFFDRPGRLIPLMRLMSSEKQREYRIASGKAWLKSQGVVVTATVRNGMAGLPSSVRNLNRLRHMFGASWVVFVENDSHDSTRQFLFNWTRVDPNVVLLGCGTVNSPDPCKMNIRYRTGKQHNPGADLKRTFEEEVDRGLVMSALRNEYLIYAYNNLADKAALMLIIDPDVSWADWDLDNIAQGAYYFMAKPKLQQLCAHVTAGSSIYDPCTLAFFLNKYFGEDTKYPAVDYYKSIRNGSRDLPPVKVQSCFQAFSFYRMSEMASRRLWYKRNPGEWMCEHNTLSRQLDEVYIDPQMRLEVKMANVG